MTIDDRNPESSLADHTEIIDKLRELASDSNAKYDSTTLHIRAMALVSRLKAVHRSANAVTRARKEQTAAARQEMDQSHLGLQNLLYQKRHLEREIEKCRQFNTVYKDVPWCSEEEFKSLAPPEMQSDDEATLILRRLQFELSERQRLDQKRKELIQQKEDLLKESKAKVSTLDNVKSQIDLLVKTASDIQKKVDDLVQPISSQSNVTS